MIMTISNYVTMGLVTLLFCFNDKSNTQII